MLDSPGIKKNKGGKLLKKCIRMTSKDNVATALEDVIERETVIIIDEENRYIEEINSNENVPFGNKIALSHINEESDIIKYEAVIGKATRPIAKGNLVHVHNVRSLSINIPQKIIDKIVKEMKIKIP